MANRILEKNIFYNSISEQHLSFANQLTVHSWNDIINMLKYQANANAYYLEHLHKWLVGDDSAVTPEDFPNLLEYINYINDRFADYYTKVQVNQTLSNYYTRDIVDNKLQQLSSDLNNLHGQLTTRLSTKAETSWVEQRLSTKADEEDLLSIDYNSLLNTPTIPTNISDLYNDADFADKAFVKDLVASVPKFAILVVHQLPTDNISNTTVYLVPSDEETSDLYDEYIYINGTWELLGTAKLNLDNYVTFDKLPTKLSDFANDKGYATETYVNDQLFLKANRTDLFSKDYNDLVNRPTIPTSVSQLINDSDYIDKTYVDQQIDTKANKNDLFSRDYNELYNKPAFVSEFKNDVHYTTEAYVKEQLQQKADKSELFNKDYNELINKPHIPSKLSELENEGLYAEQAYVDIVAKRIPTKVDQLEGITDYAKKELIPTLVSQLQNDANFTDKAYVDDLVSRIPKFAIIAVDELPTENISTTTVYLLRTNKSTEDLYDEYIYIDSRWELLGSARINLDGYAKVEDIPTKVSELENDSKYTTETQVDELFQRLNSNTALKFYCIEYVTVVINGVSTTYPANSNVEIKLLSTDTFEIITTSENSILSLSAFPGSLGVYYPWLEGVKQFSNILFDMNSVDMYSKWSQGNQSSYKVQFAQYLNCIFWSDNAYVSDVSKRTNYTLYYTSQLPLCYSTIPDNTFKAFYLAFNVNSDPNWGNKAYRDSFAKATWATQVFSYYGARTVGIFGHDDPDFNIVLPKDCRGLMSAATAIENAGTFDAINTTNFGAKQGSWRDAFGWCSSLRNLYIKNLKVNLNVSWSPIEYDAIYYIISNAVNTKKITISVSPYTYNLLGPSDFELATSKNIVIELIKTNYYEDRRVNAITINGDGTKVLSNDGTYKPLPTKTSELTNDSGFLTEHQSLENYVTKDELGDINNILDTLNGEVV